MAKSGKDDPHEREKAWYRARYHILRVEGKCVRCYKRYAEPGRSMCRECLDNFNARRKQSGARERHLQWLINRGNERRAAGLCVDCGKALKDRSFSRCKACRKRRAEYAQVSRIRKRIHKGD